MHKIHTDTIDNRVCSIAYRVVTTDLKSLGLAKNPNILKYPNGEWYFLDESDVEEGKGDWGGIWLARIPSSARMLQKYMKRVHDVKTRIFKAAIDRVLYVNSYRLKTNGIMMYEEIRNQSPR